MRFFLCFILFAGATCSCQQEAGQLQVPELRRNLRINPERNQIKNSLSMDLMQSARLLCTGNASMIALNQSRALSRRLARQLYLEYSQKIQPADSQYAKWLGEFNTALGECSRKDDIRQFDLLLMQEPELQALLGAVEKGLSQVLLDARAEVR